MGQDDANRGMRQRTVVLEQAAVRLVGRTIAWMGLLALLMAPGAARALGGTGSVFPRPPSIEPKIKFWLDVFSAYGERDFIVHDREHLWRVYQVLHLPGYGVPSRSDVKAISDYLKNKYGDILNRLASGQAPVDYEERHVAALFKGEPLSAYALAAQDLRVQEGMRQPFREGLLRSRYYEFTMKGIFQKAGLPPQLVALAEIESGFYNRARSDAGAVGIWQFTRGTGRQFMRITRYHDDRLNPITETKAAAKLLRSNYLTFGSWPLAITAYDYGTAGMEQAAQEYAGNYDRIVRSYGGPHFGFASQNYYAEFLAALQIREYQEAYFPGIQYEQAPPPPPIRTDFARRRSRHRYWRHRWRRVRVAHRSFLRRRHRLRRHSRVKARFA